MKTAKYADADGSFRLNVPDDWEVEQDEEGGLLLSSEEGIGLLHVVPFARPDAEAIDPADELYAFLEDQDIELEDDEVEDVELEAGGLLALSEYVAEDEEEGEAIYWLVGVTTGPGQLVFASYSCPAGEETSERDAVVGVLKTLKVE